RPRRAARQVDGHGPGGCRSRGRGPDRFRGGRAAVPLGHPGRHLGGDRGRRRFRARHATRWRDMSVWLVILAVGAGTYVFRAAMFVVLGSHSLPAWTHGPLGFVGPAAIGALVGGMVLTDGERFAPSGAAELVAV